MIPVLETERLRMRAWRESDLEAFADICADASLACYIGGVCSRNDAWRRMAAFAGHWSLRGYGVWAIEGKADGAFKGWSGLWRPEGSPEPEVNWGLAAAAQGRGLATEAATRARLYAYETLGWTTAISLIALANRPSIRVAERLGARLERTLTYRGFETGVFRHPEARTKQTPTDSFTERKRACL
jgi:RimJ/RimL family protein N-acetyltransferase